MCEIHHFINGVAELNRSVLTAEVIDRSHGQGFDDFHLATMRGNPGLPAQILRSARQALGVRRFLWRISATCSRYFQSSDDAAAGDFSDLITILFQRGICQRMIVALKRKGITRDVRVGMSTLNIGFMVS